MSKMLAPPMLSMEKPSAGALKERISVRWKTSAPTSVPTTPEKYASGAAFLMSIQKVESAYRPPAKAGANANGRSATMPTPSYALVMKYVTTATITMPMLASAI